MNKELRKAIMQRSKLRNILNRLKTPEANADYKRQRNYCTSLLRRTKRDFFEKLNPNAISDNKMFWKIVKPLFSDKVAITPKITLCENDEIHDNDAQVAEDFGNFFSTIVTELNIGNRYNHFLSFHDNDISSSYITTIYNNSITNSCYPSPLKWADITPVHKKDDRSLKSNYRPISTIPSVSKIFERIIHDQILIFVEQYLSPYLCGFRKGYSTQYCLIIMLEPWKKSLDNRKIAGALLTDLSKAFDCLNHELLIAKLEAYGFHHSALTYIFSYLSDRKQRTKVNNFLSSWSNNETGVPQWSILGPLIFNIYMNDIREEDLANYADDNTPYAIENEIETLISIIEKDASILIKWFNDNYLKLNEDKHNDNVSAKIGSEIITASESVKLLGIIIDNKLNFNEHISKLCKKVSQKIHALARISNFMSTEKLRKIMKAFIDSQFGYCPLIWMFCSRTLNNRINQLHERALRLVYKDATLSFEELLIVDKSFSIHHRNLQKLATGMYKVINKLSPSFMHTIFPLTTNPYGLRNKNTFKTSNIHSVYYGSETLEFKGPKTWSVVPDDIKSSKSEFQSKIKRWRPAGCSCRLCWEYIPNLGFIWSYSYSLCLSYGENDI